MRVKPDSLIPPCWIEDAPVRDMRYLEHFLSMDSSRRLMDQLIDSVHWQQEKFRLFGAEVGSPRLTAWSGDVGLKYTYSGVQHTSEGWLLILKPIRQALLDLLGVGFNFVLLNYYRNGRDSMGWHSDNEQELGSYPCIASISLGETRRFLVRKKGKILKPTNSELIVTRKSRGIDLVTGSLLVMHGNSQNQYEHALPKSRKEKGCRINLTFRCVSPSTVESRDMGTAAP